MLLMLTMLNHIMFMEDLQDNGVWMAKNSSKESLSWHQSQVTIIGPL